MSDVQKKGGFFKRRVAGFAKWTGASSISESALRTKNLVTAAFSHEEATRPPEEFDEAVKRLNLSEDDLKARAKELIISSSFYAFFAGISLFASVFYMLTAERLSDVFVGVAMISSFLLLVTLFGRASFRLWQIRNRQLGGFDTWLRSPKEWIPA